MASKVKFLKLLSPINIGKMQLKNRITLAPMEMNYNTPQGTLSEKQIAYFVRRARGGVALITAQLVTVAPHASATRCFETIMSDEYIPQWRELAKVIHDAGAKLSIQLTHVGREGLSAITGAPPISPGTIPSPATGEMPTQLTKAGIKDMVTKFGQAARRVKEAGADCVEVLGAQGQLIQNFMTPLANNRTDEYGGNLDNRARFSIEIIKRIKEEVGKEFPLVFRMVASDLVDGG
jgi:2,4-dienoyl-CoA reductase-like NADH-dependent reductase (Old Yellow Enzyme family)